MTEKCWAIGEDGGVNSNRTRPEPTNSKLSGKHYKKQIKPNNLICGLCVQKTESIDPLV